jgi:peptidyl-prolyl cis-trans isomerase A (cyclophilin A)
MAKRFSGIVFLSFFLACGPGPTEKAPSTPDDQKSGDLTIGKSPDAGATPVANAEDAAERERVRARIEKLEEEKRRTDEGESKPPTVASGPDPVGGQFALADATAGLAGNGPLVATITTSQGALSCKLLDDKAPNTVANFVGLARGLRPWKDDTGAWVKKPIYDGTTFHRVIKGFMIQGGDPRGNGTGEPGYVIKDEIWTGAKHDRAGLLCMANRGPNTNGAQFFITDAKAAHLDGNYTIFGECSPESVVHAIANVPVSGEKPKTPVSIQKVEITRGNASGKKP